MGNYKKLEDTQILEELLFKLKINKKKLSEALGYKSPMSIYFIEQGRNHIHDEMIEKIIAAFPEVNYLFLKKGEYPVLKTEVGKQLQKNLFGIPEKSETTLQELEKLPERVKKLEQQVEFLLEYISKEKSDQ